MSEIEITQEKPEATYLLITTKEHGRVFSINADGSVGYTVNGEYKIAENDKELGIALGEAFKTLWNGVHRRENRRKL